MAVSILSYFLAAFFSNFFFFFFLFFLVCNLFKLNFFVYGHCFVCGLLIFDLLIFSVYENPKFNNRLLFLANNPDPEMLQFWSVNYIC